MRKSAAFTLVKILITVIILAIVVRKVELGTMLATLAHCRFPLVILALLIFAGYQFIYVYNWGRVLSVLEEERVGYHELFKFHMIGLFYNLFLPTSMGGDLAKIYYLSKRIANRLLTIKSIVILRGTGLLTNLLLVVISVAVTSETVRLHAARAFSAASLTAAGMVMFFIVSTLVVPREGKISSVLMKMKDFLGSPRDVLKHHKKQVVCILILSFVTQILIVLENYILLAALRIDIPFIDMMYIIPLTFFATLLPITIAGLGVREGVFIFFLQRHNYAADDAVAFSLLGYSLMLLMGIAGGIINVATHSKKE
jgi:uncharacterized protein (TIRG00374 family)